MSHIRFARLSLLLAALGLNAAPTLLGMTPVVAAEAAKPAEPPKDTVRPEIYKLIDPARPKTCCLTRTSPNSRAASIRRPPCLTLRRMNSSF